MGYIIGSFNIQKLGEAAVKQLRRDFSLIAKVIREERMDIVALQEIFGDPVRHYVVSMLQNHLNHAGAMSWNASYVRSLKSDEGYAFLWNTSRIGLLPDEKYPGHFKEPKTMDHKSYNFIRPPAVGRFIPAGPMTPFIEIRVINTHIYHGGKDTKQTIAERLREYQTLSDRVFARTAQMRDGHFRPAYTFIAGDYNLAQALCESTLLARRNPEMEMHCLQGRVTTIGTRIDPETQNEVTEYTANDYDHFTCSSRECEYLNYIGRIDAPNAYCGGDFNRYKKDVSDHVPIKLHIELRRRNAVSPITTTVSTSN